eukprot:m51a1_g1673 putative protein tyrosine phosphatase type iva 1-like (170) ;mRNA; r:394053-394713
MAQPADSTSGGVPRPFSPVEYKDLRFVLFDAPYDSTVDAYIAELKRHRVRTVVRACDPTYDDARLKEAGIDVLPLAFDDGDVPEKKSIDQWLALCKAFFAEGKGDAIGVHCVAGLGRSPLLVCIALIENGYGDAARTVEFVRSKRPGAINRTQLKYLMQYKRHKDCVVC